MWTSSGWIDDLSLSGIASHLSTTTWRGWPIKTDVQDSYIFAPCWYSCYPIPFGIIQYDFALSLFLGFNFLPQTPELTSISFLSTCGIHFRLPQVSVPHKLYFCVVSCLFFSITFLSTVDPSQPGRFFSNVSGWNSLGQSLRGSWFRKTLSWEHIMTFLILRAYFQRHYYFLIKLCLFNLYIYKSNLFISTRPEWNSIYAADLYALRSSFIMFFNVILYSGRLFKYIDNFLHGKGY